MNLDNISNADNTFERSWTDEKELPITRCCVIRGAQICSAVWRQNYVGHIIDLLDTVHLQSPLIISATQSHAYQSLYVYP